MKEKIHDVFYKLVIVIWILDVINVPSLAFLDVELPINELGWFLIWVFLPEPDEKE